MKQKGQGIIEFALVVPMLVALGVAIIYVGIMFLDYTQYSNAARDAARDISVQSEVINADETYTTAATFRQNIVDAINKGSGSDYESVVSRYEHPFTNIYKSQWNATFYKLNTSTGKLDTGVDQKGTKIDASNSDTIEVSITLRLKDDVEAGSYLSSWLSNLFELPAIHYKMVLE